MTKRWSSTRSQSGTKRQASKKARAESMRDYITAAIERNDVVMSVAKMIDPGAFEVWYRSTGVDAEPIEADARKRYKQSSALLLAARILTFAAAFTQVELRRLLAESEAAGWESLGVPVNAHPELREIIDKKYEKRRAE